MTNRIVETSDGGFTLRGLAEESHNIFTPAVGLVYSGHFDFTGDPISEVEGDSVFIDPGLYLGVPDTEQRFEQRFGPSGLVALDEEGKEGFVYLPDGIYFVTTVVYATAPVYLAFDAYCGYAATQANGVAPPISLSGVAVFAKDAEYPGLNFTVFRPGGSGAGNISLFDLTIVKLSEGPDTA